MARPRLMHPLSGADLRTLATLLATNQPIAFDRLPQAGLALLAALARWPCSSLERLAVARLRRRMPPMPPPVFIVGHWRSGTTHLYNVMSKAPDFGYVPPLATGLPWDLLGIARVFRPLLERTLPRHRFIDPIPVNPDSPQEDEIALANMAPISFYHGLYFPRRLREHFDRGVFFDDARPQDIALWQKRHRYFLEKLAIHFQGRQLLIKNPVYTARIAMLRELWPGAKFIHIHRNPYVVVDSMRNFYDKLLGEFALQRADDTDVDALILEAYARMMEALVRDAPALPDGAWVELRFEDLERDPLGEIERIYTILRLDGFARHRPHFEAYLATVSGYRKHRHALSPGTIAGVRQHLGPVLERWGYGLPESASSA
jgi:hypothetical protein